MKKITLLLFTLLLTNLSSSQCLTATSVTPQYPTTTYVPTTCDGITVNSITTVGFASEYSVVTVVLGQHYVFSSSIPTDLITISADGGATAVIWGAGSVSWTSTLSGDVRFYTHLNDGLCGGQNTNRTRSVVCGTPPTCVSPTGIVFSNITINSATATWTASTPTPANGYELYLSTTNTAPISTTTPSSSVGAGVLTANLTGLISGTNYFLWIRSVCSNTDTSLWSSISSFATSCISTSVPYTQDFESAVVPALPVCTSAVNYGTGNIWTVVNNPGSGFTTNTLRYPYNSTNPANTWFFTNGINLTAGTSYRISYNYGNNSTFYTESLKVSYGVSASASDMTNTLFDHSSINSNAIQFNQVDFTPTTTGVYYFGFQAYSISNQFYLFVDNITVDLTPACSAPINLTVNAITDTNATINWTTIATATNYEYVLDTLAADPSVAGTSIATNSYNATGLTQTTTYYFHIRTNCSGTYSAWSTVMFTTSAPIPANDNCSGAIALTPGGVFADNAIIGSNIAATYTDGTIITCSTSLADNVWYNVVVPASGSITIETQADAGSGFTDSIIGIFSGTCGTLTEVSCNDDTTGGTDLFSTVSLTGQTPGAILYISVWRYSLGTGTDGTFKISAYDSSLGNNSFDAANFSYYPNPIKNTLNLSYNQEISSVEVFNILGQKIISNSIKSNNAQIDMSNLTKGAYMVKVISNDQVKTIKVIKE